MDKKNDEIVTTENVVEAVEREEDDSKRSLDEKSFDEKFFADDELTQEDTQEHIENQNTPKSSDELIDEARALVEASDIDVRDCMQILDEDIASFEQRKSQLLSGSAEKIEELLEEVGFEPEEIEDIGKEGVSFNSEEKIKPMRVKSLSSGKFSSFILSLIVAFASVAGWIYVATQKLGITPDISKLPSQEMQNKVLSWIGGGMTGGDGNPLYGMIVLGVTAILTMWIVYAIRVQLRASSNQKIAEKVSEDAKFYCTQKEECKKEMESVSEHIHKVIKTLDTFDVLFEEQNAKIRRIIYLEGKLPFHEYHQKSKDEMNQSGIIIDGLNQLISTAMADENGSLSSEAKESLEEVISIQDRYIKRFYQ